MPSAECERARAAASVALDCELSELGRARLRAHLARCPACAAFVAGLREVTHELRTAPLPAPSRPLLPRRRTARRPFALALALLAIVAAAGAGGLAGTLRPVEAQPKVKVSGARLALLFAAEPQPLPGARLPMQTPV